MLTRRDYLRSLAAAATATLALPEPRARASAAEKLVHPAAKADSVIGVSITRPGPKAASSPFETPKAPPHASDTPSPPTPPVTSSPISTTRGSAAIS